MVSTPPPSYQPARSSSNGSGNPSSEDVELPRYSRSNSIPLFPNHHTDDKDDIPPNGLIPPPGSRRANVMVEEGRAPRVYAAHHAGRASVNKGNRAGRSHTIYIDNGRAARIATQAPISYTKVILACLLLVACALAFAYLVKWVVEHSGLESAAKSETVLASGH